MKIAVVGTVDQEYTTAWHYASAFEQLSHDVERRRRARVTDWTDIEVDGVHAELLVGRIAGLERVVETVADHLFSDDGDWVASAHPLRPRERVHWLRSGTHGPEAHDSEAYPPWEPLWDVAFVGSVPGAHPEWATQRTELVARLRSWYGERFLHFGRGGVGLVDDSGNFRAELHGHWLNRFLRSVPVIVGDSDLVSRDGLYWSDR